MLIFLALGSLLGATALNFLSTLPKIEWVTIFCFLALLSITFWLRFVNKSILRSLLIMLLTALLSFGWSCYHAYQRLAWELPSTDQNRLIDIQGKIVGISQLSAGGLRFAMKVEYYNGKKLSPSVKMRLFWPNRRQRIKSGDLIQCQVKLKRPWHLANPGGIDQEKLLFIDSIRATGKIITVIHYEEKPHLSLNRFRQDLQENMQNLLENKPFSGVIQAMTLGINSNITPAQWQIFRTTGTAHIVAISGAHVGLVAMLLLNFMRRLTTRYITLTTFYPAKGYGAIIGIVGAFSYSAVAGFSIPTQRSCVMILVAMLAILKRQSIFTWHTLALSWIGIYLLDPLAPLQMGFWLSFGCVTALILGRSFYINGPYWQQWVMPQWVVFIGLFPLSVIFFQQVPLYSALANFIAVPIIGFIVMPFCLIGLLFMGFSSTMAAFFLKIAHGGLAILWPIVELIAHLPYSVWEKGNPPVLQSMLALISATLVLTPKGFPVRYLAWIGFLPLILYQGSEIKEGECRFTLLDVGQGLAAVIQTRNHTLLYDAGPQYGQNDDAGSKVIKPFLRSQYIKTLDKVIISHGDLDHRAGLHGLKTFPIVDILTSEPERITLPSRKCASKESWEWDGVKFAIISPILTTSKNRNDLSCVLKIMTNTHSILLTGDIEKTAEKRLLESNQSLKSDIIVVPHHGSLTSSTEEFLQKVMPKYALYPVGLDNHYGFPKALVLQRYSAHGAENLLVSHTGAISFELKKSGELTPPKRWREKTQHYWNTKII